MGNEWPTIQLGELAAPKEGAIAIGPFGSAMKADTYVSAGVRVIRGTNISDTRSWKGDWVFVSKDFVKKMPRCEALPDDLVLPHRGSIGEVAIVPRDGRRYFLSTSLMKATISRELGNPLFVFYYLRSAAGRREILRFGSQVGTPGIGQPLTSLRQFRVPLPPLPDQNAIAHILSTLDDKIELNRKMAATLEAMARALFKSWFVDFQPVRAKAEGRDPGLPPHLAALFPDRLVEAEGGEIPEGWHRERLLRHANLISGGTPKTSEANYWDGPIQWASAKDVSQCGAAFLIATERTITERGLRESSTKIVPQHSTVVVARGATTGRFCMFGHDLAMNQTCYALHSVDSRPFWLNCAFATEIPRLVHAAHGTAFDTITTATLEHAQVTASNNGVEKEFEGFVRPVFGRILVCLQEAVALSALRDTLLPKLISGELRVKNAERFLRDRGR